MQQEYPLHCEPLSSPRSHSMICPCYKSSMFCTLAVCQSGREPHQKGSNLGIETEWVNGGDEERKEALSQGGSVCGRRGTGANQDSKFRCGLQSW